MERFRLQLIQEDLPPFGHGGELLAQRVRSDLVIDRRVAGDPHVPIEATHLLEAERAVEQVTRQLVELSRRHEAECRHRAEDGGLHWRTRRPPSLTADDTGLPAVAAIIESLPAGTPIRVVAEVDSEQDRQPLILADGVDVHWCYRRGRPAGQDQPAPRRSPRDAVALRRRVCMGWRREPLHHGGAALRPHRARPSPHRCVDDRLLAPRRPP